jgi:hypothetical protein
MNKVSTRKDMPVPHEDIWKLLGIERSKFRRVRSLDPLKPRRKYSARDVFAFKILLTFANDIVPAMEPMERLRLRAFFDSVRQSTPTEIKSSLALWHTREEYMMIINKKVTYDKSDPYLKMLPLKRLYEEYLLQLDAIDVPAPSIEQMKASEARIENSAIRPHLVIVSKAKKY